MWRYYLSTLVHHKWRSYDAWFLSHEAQHNFLSFWVIFDFCPFTPLTIQKIKTLKKWEKKKKHGDITILLLCITNHFTLDDHMMYDSWDMECNQFWTNCCPFTPLTTWKIKILKKMKKTLKISFYTNVPKIMIICCTVPEMDKWWM